MIEAKNITKSFAGKIVLDNVSAKFEAGTITALIGPSGSGKSTLLRALSGLEMPEAGEVSEIPYPELTIVFQQLFLWPHLTIRENIELPLKGKKADEIIAQLKIAEFVDRYPNEVSLGQRQLGAFARAIALKPKYLLLDEITSALDVEYIKLVLNIIRDLKKQGVCIIMVSHLLTFVKTGAEQVIFMEKGRVVEQGSPEIMANPHTARLKEFLSDLMI
jgi:ABC-type polar amino acid transport system ATPase subunit